ncbi:MAG: sialidase family protein, partial [Clostridia bacterium]
MNIKRTVELVLLVIGWALISAGMILFQIVNYEIFKRPAAIITVFSLVLGAFALGIAVYAKKITFKKTVQVANIIMIVLLTISFVLMILFTLIISMFQPLALSTASYIIMIVGFVFTILSALIGFILKSKSYLPIVSSVALILLMLSGITWAKTQNYATFNNIENRDNIFLFENGEAGYFTFRIPSLVTLDMDTLNNNGFKLKHDVLLATAEARKNSSRDEGKIDLVGKISSDNGKTWSKAFVILTSADTLGKVGNPTPVFDKTTCKLNMVYITATKASGYNYSTYNIQGTLLPDFSFSWGEPILIDGQKILKESATLINKQLMVGPGKAVQLTSGRLVVPCSNSGKSFAL